MELEARNGSKRLLRGLARKAKCSNPRSSPHGRDLQNLMLHVELSSRSPIAQANRRHRQALNATQNLQLLSQITKLQLAAYSLLPRNTTPNLIMLAHFYSQSQIWGLPQKRDTFLGVPVEITNSILESILGSPLFWETTISREHILYEYQSHLQDL